MSDTPHDITQHSQSCAYHGDRVAFAACADCGAYICVDCIRRTDEGLSLCLHCDPVAAATGAGPQSEDASKLAGPANVDGALEVPAIDEKPEHLDAANEVVAWENPTLPGDTSAFFKTLASAYQSPTRFMASIPWTERRIDAPLIFALLTAIIGQLAQVGYQLLNPGHIEHALQHLPGLAVQNPMSIIFATLPMLPMVLVLTLFLQAWVSHALLRLFGAARLPFAATFRIYAYAQAAAILLCLPGLGAMASKFYLLFLLLTGFRLAQGTNLGVSLIAVLPVLFLQSFSSFG
ncbi:MAG: B-box zinc finger protein [Myxococcota bacterium]|nr:B-box zinc finger protein [Myxococcota bacterium]